MLVYERVSWNQSVCEDMTIFDMISDDIWWVVWHDHIWDVDPLAPTHSQAKMARNQWDFIGDRASFYEKRCGAVGDFQLFGLFHMFVCVVFFQLTYERSGPFLNVVCCAAKSTRKMFLCDLLSCFPQIEGTQTVVTTLEPLIEKSQPSYVGDDGHESWRYFFSHDSRVYLVWQYQPSLGQFSIFGECLHPGICVTISFHVFLYKTRMYIWRDTWLDLY